MREVGLNPETGGGKRGDARRLRDQMSRLFSCMISFVHSERLETTQHQTRLNMQIVSASDLWWDIREINQGNLWKSSIKLGEEFFNAITSSVVPVDTRVLRAINNSPLALDIYGWATHKSYAIRAKGQPDFFSYRQLMTQFGCDYSTPKDFKRYFLAALHRVCAVYPKLQIGQVRGGIQIHNHSRPSVPASVRIALPHRG